MRGGEWGPVHLGYESSWLPVLVELKIRPKKKKNNKKNETGSISLVCYLLYIFCYAKGHHLAIINIHHDHFVGTCTLYGALSFSLTGFIVILKSLLFM